QPGAVLDPGGNGHRHRLGLGDPAAALAGGAGRRLLAGAAAIRALLPGAEEGRPVLAVALAAAGGAGGRPRPGQVARALAGGTGLAALQAERELGAVEGLLEAD